MNFKLSKLNMASGIFIVGGLTTGLGFYNDSIMTGISGIILILASFLIFYKYGKVNTSIFDTLNTNVVNN